MLPVPPLVLAAFAALALALVALWGRRLATSPHASPWWALPCTVALVMAVAAGIVDARGLLALLAFGAACWAARRTTGTLAIVTAHAVMLTLCAGLLLHVMPGFENPLVLRDVVLGPESAPYTKYLNFDKGVAGLFLLGVYAPDLATRDQGASHVLAFIWRFAFVTVAVLLLTLAVGYVRWDPKLAPWWPVWLGMVFLTALPEEALFRGVLQTALWRGLGETRSAALLSMVIAGTLFGVAHLGGGVLYVLVATAAGIGYGWIYHATRSIGAAIVAHVALNTVHFLFFSYPSLVAPLLVRR